MSLTPNSLFLSPPAASAAAQVKGEGIYAFVVVRKGTVWGPALEKELAATVRKAIGPIATPDVLHAAPDLPKTRSGKIMRRILRKIAAGEGSAEPGAMGDTSTLSDPGVVAELVASRARFVKPVA